MKNLLILFLLVVGITSCSKDTFDQSPDPAISIRKSEIAVTVSHLSYDNTQCQTGCGGSSGQSVAYTPNAQVSVYAGQANETDQLPALVHQGNTDQMGRVVFEELEPGPYTLKVSTPLGEKFRSVYTQLHKRANIEFSF